MKTKIVLWGANEADEKLLIGVELVEKENKVLIHTIPEAEATEATYKAMMDEWRNGNEFEWPAGHKEVIRELSVADGLLPDEIKVERTDLIARAKAEWHFVVLSSKLYEMYKSEVEDFKERVDTLTDYDGGIWEELKTFWTKVQAQVQDRNLFREHATQLRKNTNELFDSMKALKKTADTEFKKKSKELSAEFKTQINEINEKIEKGLGFKPIFDQLKKLQSQIKEASFTRDDRNDLWKKIDKSFKTIKEKQFGDGQGGKQSGASRLAGRYDGLMAAINRMEHSIKRDTNERDFQTKRINNTDGQLEAQIRQAKLQMIEERIASKQLKLDDMLKTKVDLEAKMEREKAKEAARLEKAKAKEVEKELKEKVKAEIAQKRLERSPEEEAELQKAAEAIAETKKRRAEKAKAQSQEDTPQEAKADAEKATEEKSDSLLGAITETVSEAVGDVVDTVKAVGEVVADKIDDAISGEDTDKGAAPASLTEDDAPKKKDSLLGAIAATVGEALDSATDTVKAITEVVGDKVEDVIEDIKGEEEE